MQITALAGGVGGARFLRGLHEQLRANPAWRDASLTVIGNTGDDITLYGLRVCPDLDTIMYTLGGGAHEAQGWGRVGETFRAQQELTAYGAQPDWFGLGDLDLATHIARSQWLGQGRTLSQVTEALCARWGLAGPGVRLLPMSDQPVETHVVVDQGDGAVAVHFQEWWVRLRAAVPAQRFVAVGMDRAVAAPGVLQAIAEADVILLPPSNPVVSIGIILAVPGIRQALRDSSAPVVGICPLVGGRPVRGHADACLATLGLPVTADAVAGLYADFLDAWLVDSRDLDGEWPPGLTVRGGPLLMSDPPAARALAARALSVGLELIGEPAS
jgi:LPPG:FO 2-phospho-L-lactate transferase